MGLSCGEHDFDKRESEGVLVDEIENNRERSEISFEMEVQVHGHHQQFHNQFDEEFWPVEHPSEPQDEDRPVKCPIPTSSVVNDGRTREVRYPESLRKRSEIPTMVNKEGIIIVAAEPPPFQAVRKRHHTLSNGDHIITPLPRRSSLPPLPTHNSTVFRMLQHLDEFECQ